MDAEAERVSPRDPAPGSLSRVERVIDGIATRIAWIWLGLIGVIVLAVVLRFVFGVGRIEIEELQWHLYAVGFLAGIVSCAIHDRHVRVDVLRDRMRPRTRDWIDFYGGLLFLLPLVVLVVWSAVPFVLESYAVGEKSASAGGLSHRFLLKAVLPIAFVALGITSLARLGRVSRRLFADSEGEESEDRASWR